MAPPVINFRPIVFCPQRTPVCPKCARALSGRFFTLPGGTLVSCNRSRGKGRCRQKAFIMPVDRGSLCVVVQLSDAEFNAAVEALNSGDGHSAKELLRDLRVLVDAIVEASEQEGDAA